MKYYSAIKRNKQLLHICLNLKCIIPNKRGRLKRLLYGPFIWHSANTTGTVVVEAWESRWELTAKKHERIFGGDDGNILLIVMVVAQRCYQNSHNYTNKQFLLYIN